jgi:chromosome segregation ATPase
VKESRALQLELHSKKDPPPEPALPADAFKSADFDPQLNALLDRIAQNATLPPISKLRMVYKQIATFYQGKLQETVADVTNVQTAQKRFRDLVSHFLKEASVALSDSSITLADFESRGGQDLIQKITDLHGNLQTVVQQNRAFENVISHLQERFGGNDNDPCSKIDRVKTDLDELTAVAVRSKKKCKVLSRAVAGLQHELQFKTGEFSSADDGLKFQIDSLQNQIADLNDSLKKLKAENDGLVNELRDSKIERENAEKSFIQSRDSDLASITSAQEQVQSQLVSDLETLRHNYGIVTQELSERESELTGVKNQLQTQKGLARKQEIEIEELKQLLSRTQQNLTSKLECEKRQLTQSYEGTLAELRRQCEEGRGDVQKLSAALTEAETKLTQMKGHCACLQKEKNRIDSELKSLNQQFARERQLVETAARARVLDAESRNLAKVEDLKLQFENEKRDLCAYVADAFRSFYNGAEQIDEKSFRWVVDKTREELRRLASSEEDIKRLLGACNGQTVQDLVTQLLLENRRL